MHRPFMKERSYFRGRLEIESKLDHVRALLKMMCNDKWKCLERKLKQNKPNMKPAGTGTAKGNRAAEQRRKGKERRSNARAGQPKRRQIIKPAQDSRSEQHHLLVRLQGWKKPLKMLCFLLKTQPKAPDTEMHELQLRSALAGTRGAAEAGSNFKPRKNHAIPC